MRTVLQAIIEHAEGKREMVEVGVVERAADAAPKSGLGSFLAESRELLAALQAVGVAEQTKEVVKAMSLCAGCLEPLAVKDTKSIVYRTAFGFAAQPAALCPMYRLWRCCSPPRLVQPVGARSA